MKSLSTEKLAWNLVLVGLLCLALWPFWSARFPPMQDYPQHLFQTHVLFFFDDPRFDYHQIYDCALRPVYATFFLVTLLLAHAVPLEVAGKLALSLYPVLGAILVLRLKRYSARESVPWGALLCFPVVFNQFYFLGNLNFILSLPILMLVLLDFEDLMASPLRTWPILRHCLWQVSLFVTHPFCFLACLLFIGLCAVFRKARTNGFWPKILIVLGVTFSLLILGWIEGRNPGSAGIVSPHARWDYPLQTTKFFFLMFNDMQSFGRVKSGLTAILWGAAIIVVAIMWWNNRRNGAPDHFLKNYFVWVIAAIIGMFLLPTRVGDFSYVNVRFAPIALLLVAVLITPIRFRPWMGYCFAALLAAIMIVSVCKQRRLSAEIEEIAPIVSLIPPNARILPLVFDRRSPELDRQWFGPHLHDHSYYHVLVGGGMNPYLFSSFLSPVHYKADQTFTAPGEIHPERFLPHLHALNYQFFLTRGASQRLDSYMSSFSEKVSTSGKWSLYARKPIPAD